MIEKETDSPGKGLNSGGKTDFVQGGCEVGTKYMCQPLLKYGIWSLYEDNKPKCSGTQSSMGRGSQWQLPLVKRRNLRDSPITCIIFRLQIFGSFVFCTVHTYSYHHSLHI